MQPFIVCIHDATPAYARETRVIIRELAPLVGRRHCLGIIPNWRGEWPLAEHPDYCRLISDGAGELLLHGYFHQRRRGRGPTTWLAEGSDEMSGLDSQETRRTLELGQQVLTDVFGKPAQGFLPPAWQSGQVRAVEGNSLGLEYVLGFLSLDSCAGRSVPLTTWTWDCGRWRWLGYLGHGIGWLLESLGHGVPTLAIHPRDLERGFWPNILRLTRELLERGYQPTTAAALLETG
jgi:uncharacterized protein